MSAYETKTFDLFDHTVTVDCADVDNDVPAVRITATVGEAENLTTVTITKTLGPMDGAMVPPTLEQVQASIDKHREQVAQTAVHRHILKQHRDQSR